MNTILKNIVLSLVAILLSFHFSYGKHEDLGIVKNYSCDQYCLVAPGNITFSFSERITYSGPGAYFLRIILNKLFDIQSYSGHSKLLKGDFYFAFSSGLIPALDDPDIVFPFHTFW